MSGRRSRRPATPGCSSLGARTASALATLFLVRCGTRVVEPYGGMTLDGGESRANYLLKWEAIRSLPRARRDELRPVGPRDGRHRPLQDRVRWSRGPLHRGVGPRARPARAARSTNAPREHASGGRDVATGWADAGAPAHSPEATPLDLDPCRDAGRAGGLGRADGRRAGRSRLPVAAPGRSTGSWPAGRPTISSSTTTSGRWCCAGRGRSSVAGARTSRAARSAGGRAAGANGRAPWRRSSTTSGMPMWR